jgi:hypothetical protein
MTQKANCHSDAKTIVQHLYDHGWQPAEIAGVISIGDAKVSSQTIIRLGNYEVVNIPTDKNAAIKLQNFIHNICMNTSCKNCR